MQRGGVRIGETELVLDPFSVIFPFSLHPLLPLVSMLWDSPRYSVLQTFFWKKNYFLSLQSLERPGRHWFYERVERLRVNKVIVPNVGVPGSVDQNSWVTLQGWWTRHIAKQSLQLSSLYLQPAQFCTAAWGAFCPSPAPDLHGLWCLWFCSGHWLLGKALSLSLCQNPSLLCFRNGLKM